MFSCNIKEGRSSVMKLPKERQERMRKGATVVPLLSPAIVRLAEAKRSHGGLQVAINRVV